MEEWREGLRKGERDGGECGRGDREGGGGTQATHHSHGGSAGSTRPMATSENQDIAEIEAVGPILALATWPQLTNGLWIHFIDNDNAHNLMITGASGAEHLNRLGHLLSWQVRERRLYLWSEYVNTHDNPTDMASRGDRGDPNDQKWIWDRPGDIAALDEECPKPA